MSPRRGSSSLFKRRRHITSETPFRLSFSLLAPARSKQAEQSRRSPPLIAPAVSPPFFGPEPSRSPSTSPRTSTAPPRDRFRSLLDGVEATAVNHPNPTAGAPPLSPPTLLRPSPTRIKVAVSFVVPYSTSPATSLFNLGAATAGNTARRPLVAPRPGPSSCATSARMEAAQPCWTYSRPPLPPF